jgi:tetratricopeptide (TPR) repeat protein
MRVYTQVTIGQLHLELQRPQEGLSAIEPELSALDEWRKADPKDVIAPLALGAALSLAGECHVLLGEFDQAVAIYAEAAKYLTPELADATPDIRVVYGRMAAGKARADAGLALASKGAERGAMLAAAKAKAQHAIKVLESIKDDGDSGREATFALEAVRPILDAS